MWITFNTIKRESKFSFYILFFNQVLLHENYKEFHSNIVCFSGTKFKFKSTFTRELNHDFGNFFLNSFKFLVNI